jgi:plasmid maintenance system antidote protein VapI
MAKITVHPGGFIKSNYIDELGIKATELADALEV